MKPDIDYTKKLLDVLEGFDTPACRVTDVRDAGVDINDPTFFFHLRLLEDQRLLAAANPAYPALYIFRGKREQELMWTNMPMRLTSSGHDFAAALRTSSVLETIKTKLHEAAFATWVTTAGGLASAYALRQVGLG